MTTPTTTPTIKGVLFDLDGTLLDIDIDELLRDYFAQLGPIIAPDLGLSVDEAVEIIYGGTKAMFTDHVGHTNKEVFNAYVLEQTGADYNDPAISAPLDAFYRDIFPTLQGSAQPFAHTRAAIEACFDLGLAVGIATQPIFPALATQARLRWAGLDDFDLPVVSTYENSQSTKPMAHYFCDMASRIGVDPKHCVMVGDEPVLDIEAAAVGMTTFYVGSKDEERVPDGRGDLNDFISFLTKRA